MQALVVAHHPDEQEEPRPEFLSPVLQTLCRRLRVAGLVQAVGDHPGLFPVLAEHVAGAEVVGRRHRDPIDAMKEAPHQRPVQFQQDALADDVRMVGDHARLVHTGEEMHQVHERPGEVVVDHVRLRRQLAELLEHAQGKPGGGELQVEPGAMHHMSTEGHDRRMRIAAQGQDVVVDPPRPAALAKLEDHLFDPAYRLAQVGLVEVQYPHSALHGTTIGCSGEIRATLPGKLLRPSQAGFPAALPVDGILGHADQHVR